MKKIIFILCAILLVGCNNTKQNASSSAKEIIDNVKKDPENETSQSLNSSSNTSEKINAEDVKYSYPLDSNKAYEKDDSLLMNRMLFTYPSEISAKFGDAYTIDDLKNLDYIKDVTFSMLNFRIPSRSQIFSDTNSNFVIDFPKTDDYSLQIVMTNIYKDKEYSQDQLEDMLSSTAQEQTQKIVKEKGQKLVQDVVNIYSSYKNAAYSITQSSKYIYTNLYIATPSNIIYFKFKEEKEKSDMSKYIMADLLSTVYIDTEDPMIISKSFINEEDAINIYPSTSVDLDDLEIKIPDDMKTLQDKEALKVYTKEDDDQIISQVMIRSVDKKDTDDTEDSLFKEFNRISGFNIPPAYIVTMGKVNEAKIDRYKSISSSVRIYMETYTIEGIKTTIETQDKYISIIVAGSLENTNEIELLNKNILDSLKTKEIKANENSSSSDDN